MPDTFPSCFRGSIAASDPPTNSINSNLTTCLYQTPIGIANVTWCRNIIGHGLHIDLFQFEYSYNNPNNNDDDNEEDESINHNNIASFHLHLKPWLFWKKQGSKTFDFNDSGKQRRIEFSWDLTRARFLSSPEPESSFYVAITVDGEMVLLIGDFIDEAYTKTGARKPSKNPSLIMRREHMFGNRTYSTKARFDGRTHDISIDCSGDRDEVKLSFSVDRKRVLQVKRLKWKFRGNDKIEIDGMPVQVSWDVYNWLFDDAVDGHAVFMFRFEKKGFEGGNVAIGRDSNQKGMVLWQPFGVGLKGMELKKKTKKNKNLLKTGSSSSSSSASSGGSSSVMEWASMEENEMQRLGGFSLIVYAWKS